MSSFLIFFVVSFIFVGLKRLFGESRKRYAGLWRFRLLGGVLLCLFVVVVGFLAVPVFYDGQWQYNRVDESFATFESLGSDDLMLMNWMAGHISPEGLILVSSGDSGQYVMPVTGLKTACIYSYLANYSYLVGALASNASDVDVVSLLVDYNISYVYVGSRTTNYDFEDNYYKTFNVTQFLSVSYFFPVKQFGSAWLFQFNVSAASPCLNNLAAT